VWQALSIVAYGTTAAALGVASPKTALSDDLSLIQATRHVPEGAMRLAGTNSSEQLHRTIEMLAAKLPEGPTKEMLTRLKVCASCTEFMRVGEPRDGGYLVCLDGLERGKLRAAYSMGIEFHDVFSEDIYDLFKVPVHQFDCSVKQPAMNCGDCHFNKICLQGMNGSGGHPFGPNMNMQQVLELTGQADAPEDSLIMKMDVEGSEWAIYADGQSGLEKFKQLIFEFHWLAQERHHATYAAALRNIENAGFKVAHIHGNNFRNFYEIEGYMVPRVLEVTFVKNNPSLEVCETEQHLHPLDQENNRKGYPCPLARLPA
jgi:hypothetical protein